MRPSAAFLVALALGSSVAGCVGSAVGTMQAPAAPREPLPFYAHDVWTDENVGRIATEWPNFLGGADLTFVGYVDLGALRLRALDGRGAEVWSSEVAGVSSYDVSGARVAGSPGTWTFERTTAGALRGILSISATAHQT